MKENTININMFLHILEETVGNHLASSTTKAKIILNWNEAERNQLPSASIQIVNKNDPDGEGQFIELNEDNLRKCIKTFFIRKCLMLGEEEVISLSPVYSDNTPSMILIKIE